MIDNKVVIGLVENIVVQGRSGDEFLPARIDTGATKSSIDFSLAKKLGLGPVIDSKIIKNANGRRLRPIVQATIVIGNKTITDKFTLADRSHMKYKILIGQNIIKRGFLINPDKKKVMR